MRLAINIPKIDIFSDEEFYTFCRAKDLEAKMTKWIENGVRLAWLIDPKKRETHVYFEGKELEMVKFKNALSGHGVLPGLELVLDSIL